MNTYLVISRVILQKMEEEERKGSPVRHRSIHPAGTGNEDQSEVVMEAKGSLPPNNFNAM